MIHYLVKLRVFCYGFLSFAKNIGKIISKNVSKKLNGRYSQKFLNHAKQSAVDALKTASKKQFKKQQKQLVIWLVIKLQIKSQKSKKIYHIIIKKKILDLVERYLKKDIYLQEIQQIIDDLKYNKIII